MNLSPTAFMSPTRPGRAGYLSLSVLAIVLALWSALAPVTGTLTVAAVVGDQRQQPQVVALETAVVAAITVSEGQFVTKGQVLLRLNTDDLMAQRALADARYFADLLDHARVLALIANQQQPQWDDDLRQALSASKDLRERAVAEQRRLDAARAEAAALRHARRLQGRAAGATLAAIADQLSAVGAERAIVAASLARSRDLADSGLATRDVTARLARDLADLDATLAQLAATRAATEGQQIQTDLAMTRDAAALSAATEADLRQISDRIRATASDRARLTAAIAARTLTAPAEGIISDLQIAAAGETVIAGRPILRIIPPDDRNLVTARIGPDQIDKVHVGMPVHLRPRVADAAGSPPLDGKITAITPAPVAISSTGETAFLATIRLSRRPADQPQPQSGRSVDVVIPVGHDHPLVRLLAPLTNAFGDAVKSPAHGP